MAKTQTIVTTVIPRGVALNADPLPVSVFVTPRLRGADTLGAFPDWLAWTRRLAEHGLTLTLRCNGNEHDVAVDPGPLEPELWEALFTEETSSARTSSTTTPGSRCCRTRCGARSAS